MSEFVVTEESLAAKFEALLPHLDERQRRLLLGVEARMLGHGGGRLVARAAGVREVLFDWDGDHLYEFVVGRRRYADPYYLDACEDDDVPLAEVAGRAGKVIGYTYDLGACWEHRIVVDAVEPALPGARYPRCVAGVGPYPAEYDGDRPRRLDLDALNKRLAKLPLQRKASASAPARVVATPQVRALAADARQASLLQDLVRLARWTAHSPGGHPHGRAEKARGA